jgi:hypothetical protein
VSINSCVYIIYTKPVLVRLKQFTLHERKNYYEREKDMNFSDNVRDSAMRPRFDISPAPCVAYGSVLPQMMDRTYSEMEALDRGTIFPELDLPYSKYGYVCTERD